MTIRTPGAFSVALTGILTLAPLVAGDDPPVPYPQDYRQWTFLHATMLGPQHGVFSERKCEKPCTAGVMYFYANDKAMEGLRTGKFKDGAILADEVLEMHGLEDGGAREGPRRGVGVMVRDSKLYAATGGWGYGSFDGDSRTEQLTPERRQACFQCHVSKKDNNYVFTTYRER